MPMGAVFLITGGTSPALHSLLASRDRENPMTVVFSNPGNQATGSWARQVEASAATSNPGASGVKGPAVAPIVRLQTFNPGGLAG